MLSTLVLSISGKFSDFQHFFFDMLFTNIIYHFQSIMSGAKSVWEEKEFCIFFPNFERNSFALWTKLLRQFPQNCILCMQRNIWMILFVKNPTFRIHSVYERKNFVLREKKLGSLLKTALCVYWSLFSNFHPVFCGFWRYQKLSERFLVWLAKASFYRSRFLLEDECFFLEKLFFVSFSCTSGKRFLHNELGRFCNLLELASYMSRRKAWKKTFSWKDFLKILFWLSAERFQTLNNFFRHALHKVHF